MDLQLVNPQAKYPKVTLLQPPPLGYIHVAATVGPPPGRTPFPGRSPQKATLLNRLGSLARELERLAIIERATVYRAILFAPPAGAASQAPRLARHDVVVLIETTSPEVLGEVQAAEPYKVLAAAVTEAAAIDDHQIVAALPGRGVTSAPLRTASSTPTTRPSGQDAARSRSRAT